MFLFGWQTVLAIIPVLVSSGCRHKILQTGWLVSNRNFLLTVLEAGRSRLVCQHGCILVKALSEAADGRLPALSSHGGRAQGASTLTLFMKAPPSRCKHLPESHLLVSSHWALGFQHRNFGWGDTHSDHCNIWLENNVCTWSLFCPQNPSCKVVKMGSWTPLYGEEGGRGGLCTWMIPRTLSCTKWI